MGEEWWLFWGAPSSQRTRTHHIAVWDLKNRRSPRFAARILLLQSYVGRSWFIITFPDCLMATLKDPPVLDKPNYHVIGCPVMSPSYPIAILNPIKRKTHYILSMFKSACSIVIWWFPKIGMPPVVIHFHAIFHEINHPAIGYPIFGIPPSYGQSRCNRETLHLSHGMLPQLVHASTGRRRCSDRTAHALQTPRLVAAPNLMGQN